MEKFPKAFLLGAATAAHQVEGNNIYSDAWAEEQMKHSTYLEPSGAALDHYHRYEEDIRLMSKAGLNAYRFSIEWARIEPQEGIFAPDEIEHYRKVISCCRENGLEPIVTLLHFTSPKWLISRGGWESDAAVAYFVRYVRYVMEQLGEDRRFTLLLAVNVVRIPHPADHPNDRPKTQVGDQQLLRDPAAEQRQDQQNAAGQGREGGELFRIHCVLILSFLLDKRKRPRSRESKNCLSA